MILRRGGELSPPRSEVALHKKFCTSSPKWLMTLTQMLRRFGFGNGREVVEFNSASEEPRRTAPSTWTLPPSPIRYVNSGFGRGGAGSRHGFLRFLQRVRWHVPRHA
jgi:hypothetical protein